MPNPASYPILDQLVDYKLSFEEARASSAPVSYALSGSGLVVVYKTLLGVFWTVYPAPVPGLPSVSPGFELSVPKPPVSVLLDAVALLKQAYALYKTETLVLVCYDHQKREYFLDCPQQRVSSASVRYSRDPQSVLREANGEVSVFLEIHSHPGSLDTFSSTDDADEKSIRFYAVTSSMQATWPALTLSFGVNGRRYPVDSLDQVFDITFPDFSALLRAHVQPYSIEVPARVQLSHSVRDLWKDDLAADDPDDLPSWQDAMGLLDSGTPEQTAPSQVPKPLLVSAPASVRRRGRPPKGAR